MAIQKGLYTSGDDFASPFVIGGKALNPYLHFDGENMPDDEPYQSGDYQHSLLFNNGEGTVVDGVVGSARQFAGNSFVWRDWDFPKMDKASISFWVNMSQQDIDSEWTIFATNRGDSWGSDMGLHVASWYDELNIRAYAPGGSVDLYSTDHGNGFMFEANRWYHVVLLWDKYEGSYDIQAFVDGEMVVGGNVAFEMEAFERSMTIGNMDLSFPFYGKMDEFMLLMNEDSLTEATIPEYYSKIKHGTFDDSETGSLKLGKGLDGTYPEALTWISRVLDLGGQGRFIDFGFIEATAKTPAGTGLIFYSSSSPDGNTWEPWQPIAEDGSIVSTNQRFVRFRVDFISDGSETPVLEELRIYEEKIPVALPDNYVKHDDPLFLYNDKETGLDSLGELANAYDIILDEEINGEESLSFKIPYKDGKRKEIGEEPVEMVASLGNRYFVVKEILDKRDSDGNIYSEFICEGRWTELRDWFVDGIEMVEVTAEDVLNGIFNSVYYETGDTEIDWTVGNVEIKKRRTIRREEWTDVLSLIHTVQNTWGGEILFDTKNKVVHLLERIGTNRGIRFTYRKNLKTVERRIDTYDLVTRIYPTGAGGLDIRTLNNGVPYLENREWVDKLKLRRKVIPYRWKDERYTIPQNLVEDAQAMLDELSKPNIAYATVVHDLSSLTGHEHEAFELGDDIMVEDDELFEHEFVNRIVRRSQNVRLPEETVVEISQVTKTLADVRSRSVDEQVENLISSDLLTSGDVNQMTVFNQLLNSRGDDGFSYWISESDGSEFELANAGFSGSWSFKVTPDFDKGARLTQRVEGVSHRSTYTVSASVATEGEIVRGASSDAFVGIKVNVYYEGETEPEEHYLAIPDVTTQGGE